MSNALRVVRETPDPALLALSLRTLADIEQIERTPLDEGLRIADFSVRLALGLASRPPDDTAISSCPAATLSAPPQKDRCR